MTTDLRITPAHLRRTACIYVRQSTAMQLERNPESTDRQYGLKHRAVELGWSSDQIVVIDDDLGMSGSGTVERSGFERMAAKVALGRVGIILALEVSRLARNNADWYRLLDLCSITDTLIGDGDGLHHPGHFNDRLVLGLKGTMSEAELHILRARLDGGIRNKAARGELRRSLPVGYVWGDDDGEVRFDPDEAVTGAIRTTFQRFTETGSARQVWLWFRSEGLTFPSRANMRADIRWITPTYTAIHQVLTNPVYAGVYVYGKTRRERYVDGASNVKKRIRRLPQPEWAVFLPNHHEGFIDLQTFEQNKQRIAKNTRPQRHQAGGAVRGGAALLQGLATCGRCGRRLKVAKAFLEAITPAGIEAALQAETDLEAGHDAALEQWRLQVERARYAAERAERQYMAVEPENRLVARGLESEWEKRLRDLARAEEELARHERQRPDALTEEQREAIAALGTDIERVWSAPTTTDRDRKELLVTLLEEVNIVVNRDEHEAALTMRWRGGKLTELNVDLWQARQAPNRTDENTIDLIRRLARHYDDATIAGILNRQERRTSTGLRFNANRVNSIRQHWKIPRFEASSEPAEGKLVNVTEAAEILQVAPSTVHRWINDGFLPGEQLTPGAPWRIRITDEVLSRFVEDEREGYLPMLEATMALGVSRQTVLQRVKRGELEAVHLRHGKRKGLRIKVIDQQQRLFEEV